MGSALEARGFGKRYRRRWAIRDLDLTIPEGSVTALVGPNGAGKSTLIKGWVGFARPTAGTLTVAGIDPWKDRGAAIRLIGYVPQAASLYRELTVEEHLTMAHTLRAGFDRPAARVRLRELDIPLTQRADTLSGGQQAQVGLAIALGTHAPVLLLDEPLASLDPLARREFLHVLVDGVRAAGATALLSSHVISDIEQACDRLLVLGSGRKLLDVSIPEAIATHRVLEADDPGAEGAVGAFPGPSGERLALVAIPRAHGDETRDATLPGRPATLEEVVLGHLAVGRSSRWGARMAAA
ncbi:MAG TPA: ABC transporter ATP-binding protein [Candidatus Acidoferrum sp.]|nr:ABC transporter ATP-binding protein [Candidatus Acidoferrum sp.]